MKKGLIVGPVVSEFGWELMEWQGHVRQCVKDMRPDRLLICTTAGLEPLYSDFCVNFVAHHIKCDRDGHKPRGGQIYNPHEYPRALQILRRTSNLWRKSGYKVSWMQSWGKAVKHPRHFIHQKFVKYGNPENIAAGAVPYKLLIHARSRSDGGPCGGDNYPRGEWKELLRLILASDLVKPGEIGAIGTREAAMCMDGAEDARDVDLKYLMDLMSGAQLVIGPSSGPIHLASLCGTPHVVWATGKYQSLMPQGNRDRYEKVWNPLNTPVDVLIHNKGQILPPETIAKVVLKRLKGRK